MNDSLGHAAGDVLLQTVAERIRSTVRGEDSVTRLGGDEFAVLATEVYDTEDAVLLAERIIAAVKRTRRLSTSPNTHGRGALRHAGAQDVRGTRAHGL